MGKIIGMFYMGQALSALAVGLQQFVIMGHHQRRGFRTTTSLQKDQEVISETNTDWESGLPYLAYDRGVGSKTII